MRRSSPPVRAALAASLLALLVPARLEAVTEGQAQYLKAVRAYEDEDWDAAIRGFRAAIAEDSKEGLRKVRSTGINFDDYLPHYYLGMSLWKAGRPAEARKALEESDRQGVVAKKAALAAGLRDALSRLPAAQVAEVRPTAPPTVPPTAAPPPTHAPSIPTVRVAPPLAPTSTPARTPGPTAVVVAAATAVTKPTPEILVVSSTPPVTTLTDAERSVARAGVREFFEGRYAHAAKTLAPVAPRAAQTQLVYAFALAGRYVLEGRTESALLEKARVEFAAARRAGARLDEDGFVAPEIRSLLGS